MNQKDWAFVVSCILGDGSLTPITREGRNTVMISFTHCKEQKPWLEVKASELNRIFDRTCKIGEQRYFDDRTNKWYDRCQYSLTSKELIPLLKQAYPDGKKTFTKELLKELTTEHLSVLWADDGNLEPIKRVGRLNLYEPPDQCELVNQWIQSICGAVGRYEDYEGNGTGRLRYPPSEMMKIAIAIAPYTHQSMVYKINMQYKRNTAIRQNLLVASSPNHLLTLDSLPLVKELKHCEWEVIAKKFCISDTRNKSKEQLRSCIVQVMLEMSGQ